MQIHERHAASQVIVEAIEDGGPTEPRRAGFHQLFLDEAREVFESSRHDALAQRLQQEVLDFHAVLHGRQGCGRVEIERVALAEVGIRADALFVVVLERAPQCVGDVSPRHAVADGHAYRTRVGHRRFERVEGKLQRRGTARRRLASGASGGWVGRSRAVALLLDREDLTLAAVEVRRGDVHALDRLEGNGERADAGLDTGPRRFRRHGDDGPLAAARQIVDGRAQDRQGLVDGGRLRVIARVETHAARAGRQQDQSAPECAVEESLAPVGPKDVEGQHHTDAADVAQDLAVLAREGVEAGASPLTGAAHLVQVQLVEQRQQPHHPDRVALPGRVELLFFLEERGQLLAHEEHAVLGFLGPRHHVGRARQVEQFVRPQPSGHAPAGLHFVEDQRHVVDLRQDPQPAHEARARHPHASFALDGFDQHGGDAFGPPYDIGREAGVLRLHERAHAPRVAGLGTRRRVDKFVDSVHLALERVLALFRARQTAGHEQVPQLFQAALLAARGLLRRPRLLDGERNVRPIKRRKSESRPLAVCDGERAQRAAVERPVERDDEAAVAVRRGHDAVHQDRLDGVFHRFRAGVDDEMARRAGRRDPRQRRLEAQRQDRLVLRVRVASGHERQRFEHRADNGRLVVAERLGGDECAHVEEAVGSAAVVAIDDRQIGAD